VFFAPRITSGISTIRIDARPQNHPLHICTKMAIIAKSPGPSSTSLCTGTHVASLTARRRLIGYESWPTRESLEWRNQQRRYVTVDDALPA
jgi:hypothetical protein